MPSILRTPIIRKFHNYTGDVITQGSVTIVTASTGSVPAGSTVTVYSSETGIGTLSQPLSLQSDGGVNGWLEIGIYDMTAVTSIGTVTSRYYVNHPEQSILQGTALTDNQFQINDDGDTDARFKINSGGTVTWGSGAGAGDTTLYRSGAGTLTTSSAFNVGGTITAAAGTVTGNLGVGGNFSVAGTAIDTAWQGYNPTVTGSNGTVNPTFGSGVGTVIGHYKQIGKTVFVRMTVIVGTSPTIQGTAWTFPLPSGIPASSANFSILNAKLTIGGTEGVGTAYLGEARVNPSGTNFQIYTNAAVNPVGTTTPVSGAANWATNSSITISGFYESA
jgi:hypothetical protein